MRFGCGSSSRDWIHVLDAAQAVVQAIEHLPPRGIHSYDIGSGRSLTIRALVELIARLAGSPRELIEFNPALDRGDTSIQAMARRLPPGFSPSISIDNGIGALLHSLNRSKS
jgi:nucleoside-diphosphate-sugar epimerase